MTAGKALRLERLVENGRMVFIPMDDGLLGGPEGGLRYQQKKVEQIVAGGANGVLGFKSLARYPELFRDTGLVLNLTASTSRRDHTRKVLISSVEEALRLGADGVGVHVNITSQYESEMLRTLGQIGEECVKWGVPLLALMYPRREGPDGQDDNYDQLRIKEPEKYAELVRHAARVGVELGADIIKTKYTGSRETFRTVVESCGDVPVVIAGGPKVEDREILTAVYEAVQAGGAGVCIGRNGFHRNNTTEFVRALRAVVHEQKNVEEVLYVLRESS